MREIQFWDHRNSSLEVFRGYSIFPFVILGSQEKTSSVKDKVQHVLSLINGVQENKIQIEKTLEGKPFWRNSRGLHLSYSHSGDVWAAGFSDQGLIGVDIESLQQNRDFEGLARRFFSARENQILGLFSDAEKKKEGFLKMWTAKEALVKALGVGLKNQIHRVEVDPWTAAILSLPQEFGDPRRWSVDYCLSAWPWIVAVARQEIKSST